MPNFLITERDRLVLWLPVLIGCGIAAYFSADAPPPVWPFALSAAFSVGLLFLLGQRFFWRLGLVAVLAFSLGYVASGLRLQRVDAPVLRDTVFFKKVTGIIKDIEQQDSKTRLILRDVGVEGLEVAQIPKQLSISLRNVNREVRIGDHIRIKAMLFPPPTPAMPGAYDFSRMFYFKQRGAVGFSPRQPEIVARAGSQNFVDALTSLRLSIADRLFAQMDKDESAVAAAMMVGEQSHVSDEVSEAMRDAGIYHILSISGMHMTLACGIIFYAVRLLLSLSPVLALRLPVKKIAASAGLVGGFAYLLLAGYPVPAIRSYVMVACVLLAVLLDRKGISLFSLAWAASLILLVTPDALFTASFQLTFAATLAIVALYERYGHVMFDGDAGIFRRLRLYFFALMLTSLAASAFTTPLALYHFNRIAVWGVFANMVMVPLSSFVVMPAAVLAFLMMPLGVEFWSLQLLNWGIHWMIEGSRWVSSLPLANIILPAPSVAGYVVIIMGGLWLGIWRTRLRLLGVPLVVGGLVTSVFYTPYDLIVSEDAKRIAYRSSAGEWVFLRGDTDSFEAENWLRTAGATEAVRRKAGAENAPELLCNKTSCYIERNGHNVIVAIKRNFLKEDICESGADIAIADYRLVKESCDEMPHIIDREFVNRHGAVAIRLHLSDIEIKTTNETRGHWPWSVSAADVTTKSKYDD